MLILFSMKDTSEEIQKLRAKAEASLNRRAQPQQVLAQIEATLLRKESQKVSEKSNNK